MLPERVHEPDSHGDTPIQWTGRYIDSLSILLAAKADPNSQNHKGWTPLHRAAASNHKDITKHLLEAKANPLLKDQYGGLPVDWARGNSSDDIVQILTETKEN
eukprot:TRINITY_DN3363_c0_g1_i6.p3 TRINITY_DN3363_c0_g1~~TRINITY_DN3363_c0_g1_i6.p3  ORF type:complete len:103 (+),score=24.35 TRINITY_DN3363_c0_g1_i6:465-773(+)